MYEHDGWCMCGKRTYMFAQCLTCLANDVDEEAMLKARREAKEHKEMLLEQAKEGADPFDYEDEEQAVRLAGGVSVSDIAAAAGEGYPLLDPGSSFHDH